MLRQFMKPILNFQGSERILDVGCGFGAFGKLIQPYLGPNAQLIGIDIDPVQVAYGNQHWARQPNMHLEVGDANQITYPDRSFDVVASMGLLEFVPTRKQVLQEMARVLRRPGKLIVVHIDIAHYVVLPWNDLFEHFWGSYLEGMRRLGADLELAEFRAYCAQQDWILEEFTLNIEYRTEITEKLISLWGTQFESEHYKQQYIDFNFQFVKQVGWTKQQLQDLFEQQRSPDRIIAFFESHIGEDFYQKTPFRVFRVPFLTSK